jgi:hypothetical protein
MGVLLSIHMTSNRPAELVQFFDRLDEATNDPQSVEVVIKIDVDDRELNEIVCREQQRRRFKITLLSTPLEGGFFGLWRWYDHLLKMTDPTAYFVVSLNDEMYFVEKGWDARLRKYVGLYADGIYRLRVSMHRERNTFDYWEASCAGELTPIITKKWLDLGGGWCPCNGPDSFQNAVAFYFGWLYRHDTFNRPYRERIVHDIEFGAQGSNLGLSNRSAQLQRIRGGMIAWFKLVSYPMQQEAARRAQILHAHIWAANRNIVDYDIGDDTRKKVATVIERSSRQVLWTASYRISRTRITWTNFIRKFWYVYYGGAGEPYRNLTPEQVRYYFLTLYDRSLQELPNPTHSRAGNCVRDNLVYRYVVTSLRIVVLLVLRR